MPETAEKTAVKIKHSATLNESPALPLAVIGWQFLLTYGYGSRDVLLQWDQKAFYAIDPDTGGVIGVLVYSHHEWRDTLFVALGYVLPEYRERGIYRQLWQALIAEAKKLGRSCIQGMTHVNNTVMHKANRKLGREAVYITYDYRVTPDEEPEQEE